MVTLELFRISISFPNTQMKGNLFIMGLPLQKYLFPNDYQKAKEVDQLSRPMSSLPWNVGTMWSGQKVGGRRFEVTMLVLFRSGPSAVLDGILKSACKPQRCESQKYDYQLSFYQ